MAINLSKITTDLAHKDPQIQTFALISITRLSPNLVDDAPQVRGLLIRLDELIRSSNPDVVFLARKASNHLRANFREFLGEERRDPASLDPAKMSREELLAAIGDDQLPPTVLATLVVRLVDRGRPEDLDRLAPLLRHGNDRVRSNALEVFVRHGGNQHLALVRPLAEDPSNRVRGTAVLAMERFGDPTVPETLTAMLRLSAISMRETAVWVLSQIEKPWAGEILAKALEDPYDGIRLRSVRALAKFPTRESIRALKQAMNDIDINICEAAHESLRALQVLIQGRVEAQKVPPAQAPAPAPPPAAAASAPAPGQAQPGKGPAGTPAAPPGPAPATRTTGTQPAAGGAASPQAGSEAVATGLRELGTSVYQLCRLNQVNHDRLDTTFYEILRYQDFLRAFLIKKQKQGGGAPVEGDEAIRQLQQRIAGAFVELGRVARELLDEGALRIPSEHQAEVQGILARLGG